MDKTYISDSVLERLKAKKEETGKTNAIIAEESGVPESTVAKLFNGTIKSPTLDTVLPIAGVLKVPIGVPGDLVEVKKQQPADQHYLNLLIDNYKAQLRSKDKWIAASMSANAVLMTAIVFVLIWDITHHDMGWVQYATARGWMELPDWIKGLFAI